LTEMLGNETWKQSVPGKGEKKRHQKKKTLPWKTELINGIRTSCVWYKVGVGGLFKKKKSKKERNLGGNCCERTGREGNSRGVREKNEVGFGGE